jgi:CheY-like chemotaxis protein
MENKLLNKELPICIIEDNKPIRKLFSTILQKSGYLVVDFSNGTSALEWLQDNIPLAVIIDILLDDINGTEVMKKIRQNPNIASVLVIAITGFVSPGDKEKHISFGFDSYIPKPINPKSFVGDIENLINKKNNE